MSPEYLSTILGSVTSLMFSYVPGLAGWYGKLEATYKKLAMAGVLAVIAIGVYGCACGGWFGVPVTCDQAGAEVLLRSFLLALMANQSTYLLSRR
jgi:uncharacterized membrane protein YeaQ/YmgE (transglycosylase-associated protein family)